MRVVLLFGGPSAEHEISVRSARTICAALAEAEHAVCCVGIDRAGRWWCFHETIPNDMTDVDAYLEHHTAGLVTFIPGTSRLVFVGSGKLALNTDVVFPLIHGRGGEDGAIQGYLQTVGVPYVGCSAAASIACFDKILTKRTLPPFTCLPDIELTRGYAGAMNYPTAVLILGKKTLFVKPARSGSSIGVSRVTEEKELHPAIQAALEHDDTIIIEPDANGREMECAVIETSDGFHVSMPGEIIAPDGFYSYREKYDTSSTTRTAIPANVSPRQAQRLREMARTAFMRLGCRGLARVDMFMSGERVVVNEVNTMPGFTPISMYPQLLEHDGMPLREQIKHLLISALRCAQR